MSIQTLHLSVDGIVEIYSDNGDFRGIALPGGFVDIGESVEDALRIEITTGILPLGDATTKGRGVFCGEVLNLKMALF